MSNISIRCLIGKKTVKRSIFNKIPLLIIRELHYCFSVSIIQSSRQHKRQAKTTSLAFYFYLNQTNKPQQTASYSNQTHSL
nr:MAG TPA: hypothetical protein [Caudoviricetes sp.]